MVAVAGHAYLGADVLEVSLGEAARVAAELHLRVLVAMVLAVALPNRSGDRNTYCLELSICCLLRESNNRV